MLIPTFLAIAVIVFTLIEAASYEHQGAIKIARWAWPVLVVSLIFSFPFSLVSMLYSLLAEEMIRGRGLAIWITNSWRNFGALFALNWLVVFALLKATKGVVVLTPEAIKRSKGVLTGALAFLTIADGGFFLLFSKVDRPRMVCSAISPDGSIKATAGFHGFLDASWFMVLERNAACPLFALTVNGSESLPPGSKPGGNKMLAWSKDSRIVSLWFGSIPVSAYDWKEQRKWRLESEAYRLSLPDSVSLDGATNLLSLLLSEGFSAARFLADAIERGDVSAARDLIARGANVREKVNDSTLLTLATEKDKIEMVRLLLNSGADPNQTSYNWGATVLVSAAVHGDAVIVRELLAHGASVNAKRDNGTTALNMAAYYGHKEVVQMLLDGGADVNATDNKGETALSLAEQKGHKDVAELLRAHQGLRGISGQPVHSSQP